jgi:hypothetical protein
MQKQLVETCTLVETCIVQDLMMVQDLMVMVVAGSCVAQNKTATLLLETLLLSSECQSDHLEAAAVEEQEQVVVEVAGAVAGEAAGCFHDCASRCLKQGAAQLMLGAGEQRRRRKVQ